MEIHLSQPRVWAYSTRPVCNTGNNQLHIPKLGARKLRGLRGCARKLRRNERGKSYSEERDNGPRTDAITVAAAVVVVVLLPRVLLQRLSANYKGTDW